MASPPPDWGETVCIGIHGTTRYICTPRFFLFRSRREYLSVTVSNLDWFVCSADDAPCIATTRAGTPRVKNRDLARPFPPAPTRINRYYFSRHVAAATCPGVYIT